MVPTRCYVPVRRVFSTFPERVSTRWSTGKIQPSFWMTQVRPVASMLVNIAIDSLLVAFIKLGHAIGGLYMCVRLYWQESANWYRITTIESQLGNCVHSWLRVGHVTKKTIVQVDNLGELISPYLTSRPLQSWCMMNVAIPWNALPCFICFHHHLLHQFKPEASLWGKTLVVLEFRAEMIVNDHLIAINHSDSCKGIVATILSLPIEWEFDLARHCSMPLGHSPPSPSFSACKSSLWPRFPIIESKLTLFILSFFRIAIWNRNIVVSLIVAIVWLGGVALNIRRTSASWSPVVEPSTYDLCPASAWKDSILVRSFTGAHILESTNWRLWKLFKVIGTVRYNPKIDACAVTDTHRVFANGIGILVVDVMLLLTMLTGLLRYAYMHSTGIWKFLYRQVTLKRFSSTCGWCWLRYSVYSGWHWPWLQRYHLWSVFFLQLDDIQLTVLQVFLILNLNGVWLFFPYACSCTFIRSWTVADDALALWDLSDVWNEVQSITLCSFIWGLI